MRAAIDQYSISRAGRGSSGRGAVVICTCLNITDKTSKRRQGRSPDLQDLQEATKIGTVCGGCKVKAEELLHEFVHIYF